MHWQPNPGDYSILTRMPLHTPTHTRTHTHRHQKYEEILVSSVPPAWAGPLMIISVSFLVVQPANAAAACSSGCLPPGATAAVVGVLVVDSVDSAASTGGGGNGGGGGGAISVQVRHVISPGIVRQVSFLCFGILWMGLAKRPTRCLHATYVWDLAPASAERWAFLRTAVGYASCEGGSVGCGGRTNDM